MLVVEQALGRSVTTEAEHPAALVGISRLQGKLDSTSLTRRHSTRIAVSLSYGGRVFFFFWRYRPALGGGRLFRRGLGSTQGSQDGAL